MTGSPQSSDLTAKEANRIAMGACLPLRFLFSETQQRASRAQYAAQNLSDPELFYVIWNVFGLDHFSVRPHMSAVELDALDTFVKLFNGLNWQPTQRGTDVRTLDAPKQLESIRDAGKNLHDILATRELDPQ